MAPLLKQYIHFNYAKSSKYINFGDTDSDIIYPGNASIQQSIPSYVELILQWMYV